MKNEVAISKIANDVYQVETGKKAIVIPAKSHQEAFKKACKYLPINCNEISLKSTLKAK
jgi:glutamate/tyrosine decarboxylase-like PLP-dependent enzyme